MKPILWSSALVVGVLAVIMGGALRESVAQEAPAGKAQTADRFGGWIGRKAAGFALPDTDGRIVDVGRALGKQPVVLVFYRGVW